MGKIGVITNLRSQKNKQNSDLTTKLRASLPRARHVILDSVEDIPEILTDFARREIDIVAIAGGDGTVQAVLTELFGNRPYEIQPCLAVIPCGMTNMIACDVAMRGNWRLDRFCQLLQATSDNDRDGVTVTRQILRLENARGKGPQYGMFFGGAGIYRAIMACRNKVHPYKIKGDAAAGVTLAGILAEWLLRGNRARRGAAGNAGASGKMFSGDNINVTFDNEPPVDLTSLAVLTTTLERLILGSRPFWNGGDGHLRFTNIAYPPERLVRYAWRLLYGNEQRELPAGTYLSRKAKRIELAMDCPFTLDGEFFEPEPRKPVILTADDQAHFLGV